MTEITRKNDGWWFELYGDDTGPYDTKDEAKDALRGLQRFYKDNPDYRKDNNHFTKERDMKAAADKKNVVTTEPKKATRKGTKKASSKPAADKASPKKPVVAKEKSDNPFASKLDSSAGEKIEKLYLEGKSWKEIAAAMSVSVSSIRFRFLDYLIKATYDKKVAE